MMHIPIPLSSGIANKSYSLRYFFVNKMFLEDFIFFAFLGVIQCFHVDISNSFLWGIYLLAVIQKSIQFG